MRSPNINCDEVKVHVRVMRFLRPDLRDLMYDGEPITECSLFKEIQLLAKLDTLCEDETLVVNFGLVDWFPSVFYRILLALREVVHEKKARLLFCCIQPNVREGFDLLGGSRTFEVRATEARAVLDAKH